MLVIYTKFLGPTPRLGSRVKAWIATNGIPATPVTREWDHYLTPTKNHITVAHMLANRLAWHGNWYMGDAGADKYVFVRDVTAIECSRSAFFIPYNEEAMQKRLAELRG